MTEHNLIRQVTSIGLNAGERYKRENNKYVKKINRQANEVCKVKRKKRAAKRRENTYNLNNYEKK